MNRTRPDLPMPVKYWSFAGLILTYWCNASCASCYVCCGPGRKEWMSVGDALAYWRGLVEACPHGCRVHLTGGEPFGDWPRLLEICRRARAEGLGPLEKVETNAFWATGEAVVRRRVAALSEAGMGRLVLSADPYHQQFVPLERVRLAARVAEEVLGGGRVQVRWRDWLAEGRETSSLSASERAALFARYVRRGRERLCGRAASLPAGRDSCKSPADFADKPCREMLLRSKHVHVGPEGIVFGGTCAGIVLGRLGVDGSVAELWRSLSTGSDGSRPILSTLVRAGPVGLLERARQAGFRAGEAYASRCQLCWEVRRWLVRSGLGGGELAPAWLYEV